MFSNILIALSASALTFNTYLILHREPDKQVILLVFLSTFSVYNLQRLIKHYSNKNNYTSRHRWIQKHQTSLLSGVLLSALGALILFFRLYDWYNFMLLFPFAFLASLYAVSLFSNRKALRDIPYLKVFIIALTWAVATVLLPVFAYANSIHSKDIILLISNFFYIIGITIPFDIRDIEVDSGNTHTIPQLVGIKKAVYLSILSLVISAFVFQMQFNETGQQIAYFISVILIFSTRKQQPELYYSGLIDGSIILFPLLNLWLN